MQSYKLDVPASVDKLIKPLDSSHCKSNYRSLPFSSTLWACASSFFAITPSEAILASYDGSREVATTMLLFCMVSDGQLKTKSRGTAGDEPDTGHDYGELNRSERAKISKYMQEKRRMHGTDCMYK